MHHHYNYLDYLPFGLFILLTLGTVIFRRFHERSLIIPSVKSGDLNQISWGEYPQSRS